MIDSTNLEREASVGPLHTFAHPARILRWLVDESTAFEQSAFLEASDFIILSYVIVSSRFSPRELGRLPIDFSSQGASERPHLALRLIND